MKAVSSPNPGLRIGRQLAQKAPEPAGYSALGLDGPKNGHEAVKLNGRRFGQKPKGAWLFLAGHTQILAAQPGIYLQVAQEIWVCEKQAITKWPGDILAYKEHLKSKLVDEEPQLTKRTHNV